MAEAEDGDWLAPHESVKRIARDPAAETEAEYSIAERFRRGKLHYRYRGSDGELHHNDLSDDFRREAVIDFATATATRPGRIVRDPNPDLPYVRDNFTPKPQWVGHAFSRDLDPFSRPDFIGRELPAEAITELKFLEISGLTGAGLIPAVGTGALAVKPAIVSGSAFLRTIGFGDLVAQDRVVTGVGLGRSFGSGLLRCCVARLDGAGWSTSFGAAALAVKLATLHVAGSLLARGAGDLMAQDRRVTGLGLSRSFGSGQLRMVSHVPTVEPAGKCDRLDAKDWLSVEVDAPTPRPRLTGKKWVFVAFKRRAEELGPHAMNITDAGRALSNESKTASDCAKPLSVGYCINLLRGLNVWPKKRRRSP